MQKRGSFSVASLLQVRDSDWCWHQQMRSECRTSHILVHSLAAGVVVKRSRARTRWSAASLLPTTSPRCRTYLKTAVTVKHFYDYDMEGHRADGTERHSVDVNVTKRDQTDYYSPPFEATIRRTNVSSVMCSYSAVNGVPPCMSDAMINQVMRKEWGFEVSQPQCALCLLFVLLLCGRALWRGHLMESEHGHSSYVPTSFVYGWLLLC